VVGFLPHYAPYAVHWHHVFNAQPQFDPAQARNWSPDSVLRSLPKWRKDTYRDRSDWRYTTANGSERRANRAVCR
jgi:hypothetical protein